jgi:molybdate transport system substrate-binding protein
MRASHEITKYWAWFARTLLGLAFAASGCKSDMAPNKYPTEARVAAAANLKFTFDEIVAAFQSQHPGVVVSTTYGSSGNFFAQLSNKAPFDMFLSADVDYPRKLIDAGLAEKNSELVYAIGRLVVWFPNSSAVDLAGRGMEALADPAVRKVAIANPAHAPYGRAAEAALKNLSLYDSVKPRLIFGENLDQAAHFLHSGAADAGITALSLALSPPLKDKGKHWLVPADAYPKLEQAGVILPWAKNQFAAELLRDFLLGPKGQDVLIRYGYTIPTQPKE